MKRAVISTILTLVYLFSTAQDLIHVSNHDVASKIYIAELKKQTVAPETDLISNSSSNLTDIDGNSYIVVKIGSQYWMAENLQSTKFTDGTKIPLVSDYKTWGNLITPGYCWYNNDAGSYRTDYGALYNGFTVSTGKLCPLGWHIPSTEEWMTLASYCGEKTAGGKLKESSTRYWMNPNNGATNETGFTALPGGSRGNLGSFLDEGLRGHWWSSTEYDKTNILNNTMGYSYSNVTGSSDHKKSGLSVRCVKD